MSKHFFAMSSRMKYINRWALMRNTGVENISEHSHEVAVIAHALAVIGNKRLGKSYNAERAALLGLYHDMPEIITGDLPTPVKYYNKEMKKAYKEVEDNACKQLLGMLPGDLKGEYEPLFYKKEDDLPLWRLVKAADKISAIVKCIEEKKAGNKEFSSAYDTLMKAVKELDVEEANIFIDEFLGSYELTVDEINE